MENWECENCGGICHQDEDLNLDEARCPGCGWDRPVETEEDMDEQAEAD